MTTVWTWTRSVLTCTGSVLLALCLIGTKAHAQQQISADAGVTNVAAPKAEARAEHCHKYDALQPQGTTSPAISTCESISPAWGGLRDQWLDNGWMLQAGFSSSGTFDLLHHESRPQLYIGQDATYSAGTAITVTYDLSRIGFAGSSLFVFNVDLQVFSYAGENPSGFAINSLYVNQRFNDGRQQLQYGFEEIGNEFYGFSIGTNSTTSPAGVGSSIPYEVGFIFNKTAPEANLRLASPNKHFYDRFGVTRSQDPDGPRADWDANNFWGLKWHIPGAGPLYINEFGYQMDASAQQPMTWLRQGVIYNDSRFADFKGGTTHNNYAYYLVGDYQLMQTDTTQPFKGFYVNVKADYAPPDRNVFSSDAGVTFYVLGPLQQAYDVFALGYTFNRLSHSFEHLRQASGFTAVDFSGNYSLSYVHRLSRGIYLSNQLSYTLNPIPSPRLAGALTWMVSLSFSY